jgi:hypothetical protein
VAFALAAALLLPLVLIVYRDAIPLRLDSDGRFLTYQNALVRDPQGWRAFWTRDYFAGAETGSGYQYISGYYRPVTNVTLWAEYRLAGTNDWQYNLDGVVLHWLNCVLLASIVWTLCDNLAAAVLAGLLFGVHPINAFAATQTKARADLVFATFYLGALAAYVRAWTITTSWQRCLGVGLALVLYAASILSKETGATLPAVLVLWHWLRVPATTRRGALGTVAWTVPFWGLLAVYVAGRLWLLQIWPHPDVGGYGERYSSVVLYANVLKNLSIYAVRMIMPYGADYAELCPNLVNFIDPTLRDPLIWLSALLLVLAPGLAVIRARRQAPAVAFFIGFFLIAMMPLLAVKNAAGTLSPDVILAQERWVYLPSAAVMALIALAIVSLVATAFTRGRVWGVLATAVTAAILVVWAGMASVHAREAESSLALLKQYLVLPDERLGRLERMNKLILWTQLIALPRGDHAGAEERCRQAVALAADSPVPAAALAMVLDASGRWAEVLPVVGPWYHPDEAWLREQYRTNVRVIDDLNRVNGDVAFYVGRALGHLGRGPQAMTALCDALRAGYDVAQIRSAAAETYALCGPPNCVAAADPKTCLPQALPEARARVAASAQPAECERLAELVDPHERGQ